jgi:hypothetical protein
MKKVSSILTIILAFQIISISSASANETGEALGGYAIVNPDTGVVHGVIVATSSDPFGNGGTMPEAYMGCPAGCLIVQQSTADQNNNVSGIHGQDVTYKNDRNVFQVVEPNTVQTQTITESVSNTSVTETEISVSRSARYYEFGVQDFRNNAGNFQINEVSPPNNTSAQIAATTTEYACIDKEMVCSRTLSNGSSVIVNESVSFNQRSTSDQILQRVVSEARNKIRQQLDLILSMLEKWIIK